MKTQAWGWLIAGVMALGLNGFYHDGGLEWAHEAAERTTSQASAVLGLAGEKTDQFLADARVLMARYEAESVERAPLADAQCRMQWAMAEVQTEMSRTQAERDRFAAREQCRMARLEVNRARTEVRIAARTAHLNLARAAFNSAALNPVPPVCQRVRVSVAPMPKIRISAPVTPTIEVVRPSAGPV